MVSLASTTSYRMGSCILKESVVECRLIRDRRQETHVKDLFLAQFHLVCIQNYAVI